MITKAIRKCKVYVATGYTDLRRGIDGLASIVHDTFKTSPVQKDTAFLFCGRRNDRYKGLLWEEDGFVMFYKRFQIGSLNWPRKANELLRLTPEQYDSLMEGIEIVARRPIKKISSAKFKY